MSSPETFDAVESADPTDLGENTAQNNDQTTTEDEDIAFLPRIDLSDYDLFEGGLAEVQYFINQGTFEQLRTENGCLYLKRGLKPNAIEDGDVVIAIYRPVGTAKSFDRFTTWLTRTAATILPSGDRVDRQDVVTLPGFVLLSIGVKEEEEDTLVIRERRNSSIEFISLRHYVLHDAEPPHQNLQAGVVRALRAIGGRVYLKASLRWNDDLDNDGDVIVAIPLPGDKLTPEAFADWVLNADDVSDEGDNIEAINGRVLSGFLLVSIGT